MLPTNIEGWSALIDELGPKDFAQRFTHPFLFTGDLAQPAGFEFRTALVSIVDLQKLKADDGLVIPLIKTDRNPYDDRIIVGRTRNCDVVLTDPSVSKFHADLVVTGSDSATLTDRNSSNGTMLGEMRLEPTKGVELKSGAVVQFGTAVTMFVSALELTDLIWE